MTSKSLRWKGFRPKRRDLLSAAAAACIATFTMVLYAAGVLDNLERQSIDERFSWRGLRSPGNDIVIVGIDQSTLQALGARLPLPRSDYARVLDRVRGASPRVIAVDTQFIGHSDPAEDHALLDAVARTGPVLLATHDGPEGLIPVPADTADAAGAIPVSTAIEQDPDGVLRRMIYAPVNTTTLPVRAAEFFDGRAVDAANFPGNHAWIDFRGPPGTFPHYSFDDVLAGRVAAHAFTGKAVLIGVTDPVNDVFVTAISPLPMPGVEVHANALWTIRAGFPLQSAGPATNIVLIALLSCLPAVFGARRSGLATLIVSIGVLILFVVGAQLAFDAGWIVALVHPVVALALSAAATIGVDAVEIRQQRSRLERDLGVLAAPLNPPTFFISYRRSDSAWHARAITKELVQRYGTDSVFMDTASIDYGEAFPDRIIGAIRVCGVMLVLIGPNWLDIVDGARRIDGPDDWVRREIEAGLQRHDALVVPFVLDGARVPDVDELPESIKDLATKHAIAVSGENLTTVIDDLMRSVDRARWRASQESRESPTLG